MTSIASARLNVPPTDVVDAIEHGLMGCCCVCIGPASSEEKHDAEASGLDGDLLLELDDEGLA